MRWTASRAWGSPPRVRGKEERDAAANSKTGITPACAGKSQYRLQNDQRPKDHPRVCGEKSFSKSPASSRRGSPPRVRGKGGIGIYSTFTHGITPACAGKSCSGCCSCSCAGDHPRVCGEKSKEVAEYASKAGSPPRVRGKVEPFKGSMYQSRITPACAGKSLKTASAIRRLWDHPRVCGEKCGLPSHTFSLLGSPPRVRGKEYSLAPTYQPYGITPACAGKS